MKRLSLLIWVIVCLGCSLRVFAQNRISGQVSDRQGTPLTGVNVFIKGTIEGTSTDEYGQFTFQTNITGDTVIVFRHITMEERQLPLRIHTGMPALSVTMKEKRKELDEVVITAGDFGVGDRKQATVMNTMDVETTAGTDGDITGALRTLPGTQQVGESGQLFVRGGSGDEAKIMIDGLDIPNPFLAGVPDVAQRNRFSPHLFKGIVFNTGGYSAQYGGALSSVLALETNDHPSKPSTVIALIPYGGQIGHDFLDEERRISGGIDVGYSNFGPYYSLIPQNVDWLKAPESGMITANFRKNTGKTGMLKWYGYGNMLHQSINYPDVELQGKPFPYTARNSNAISLLTYTGKLNERWRMYAGYGFNFNRDRIENNGADSQTATFQHQVRLWFAGKITDWATLHVGAEGYDFRADIDSLQHAEQFRWQDNEWGAWAETDLRVTPGLMIRPGVRVEHSKALNTYVLLPRISLAHRTGRYSQISLTAGDYAQKPTYIFLQSGSALTYARATHYVANFQYSHQNRIFRIESYYKNYRNLLTTSPQIANNGHGYAGGVDIFWRDSKTVNGFDYWISYTWLQTERRFMDYPIRTTPTFAAPHTAHAVAKYFFHPIGLFIGSSYSVAAGRPYYNPNDPTFLADRTPTYCNLNVNAALLRRWGKTFNTFVFAVNNLAGSQQVFSYRYSADGSYRLPVTLPYKRSFMVGWFISIGQDQSQEILEQLP
ncbi:TonB-dependent receptor [Parapedobacter defluvii]|uniref:TonB-dependent receptor n=1 Tax=Parapedobacter defluvii TaxID=2045106 RepID=UPI00334203FF